jgi:hypothetical protein
MSIRWVDTPRTLTHFEKPAPTVAEFDNELGLDANRCNTSPNCSARR